MWARDLCLSASIINNTLYQTVGHVSASKDELVMFSTENNDNSNNTSTLKTLKKHRYTAFTWPLIHLITADSHTLSQQAEDLAQAYKTSSLLTFFFYLTTWTFNLEILLRQGSGFGGAALFSLISLKKAISGQMFLPPLFLFLTGSCKAVLGRDWEQDATCVGSSRARGSCPCEHLN